MTSRRQLLGLFPGLALLATRPAIAQRRDRPAVIGMLLDTPTESRGTAANWAIFRRRMGELGHAEGKTYALVPRVARSDAERMALAAELVTLKPDVILAGPSPSALAAKRATSTIPIVAIGPAEPVKLGLIASLAKPGGNVTGVGVITTAIAGKLIELMREITPNANSIAYLADSSNPAATFALRELQSIAKPIGIAVQMFDARGASGIEAAFEAVARERIDGIIVHATDALLEQAQQIVEAAAKQRIPAIYQRRQYVEAGGLLSYGADFEWLYSRTADHVHRILRGAQPSDLPWEQASTLKLVVNLKAANALGIRIPQSVLARADEVIR